MADSPYSNKEYYLIEKELENVPANGNFIIHLGDIKHKKENCEKEDYKDFRDLLIRSPIPVFIIPGDNDYSVCNDPSQAKDFWNQYIYELEKHWKLKFPVKRQKEQKENFAFFLETTLFIGINFFEKRTRDNIKFNHILKNNLLWIRKNLKRHQGQVKTLIIFAHDFSGLRDKNSIYEVCGKIQFNSWEADQHYKYFSDRFVSMAQEFKKPILYLQGNHHCWHRDNPYKEATNIERIVISKIKKSPMTKITIRDNSIFIDRRIDKRIGFFLKEANLENVWTQYFLGSEYLKFQKYKDAKKWLNKASDKQFPPAQVLLGKMLQDSKDMSEKGYADAMRLFQSSVQNNDLNKIYAKSIKNTDVAFLPYQKRISQYQKKIIKESLFKAYFAQATMYFYGLGVPQNYKKALSYYKKSGEGVGAAYYNIALMQFNGLGVKKDFKKAKDWCIKGSSSGVIDCRFMLGSIFMKGLGVQQNYKEAVKWFKLATNHASSLYNLGFLYYKGLGVNQDFKIAIEYFMNAAKHGSSEAKKILEDLKDNSQK